jgi:hypothetical protein
MDDDGVVVRGYIDSVEFVRTACVSGRPVRYDRDAVVQLTKLAIR